MNKEVADRMSMARTKLILDFSPFFGMLSLRLKLREVGQGAMSIDGTHLNYNPEYITSLNDEELIGQVARAVTSCSLLHPYRMKQRDPKTWNAACAYAVNPVLKDAGFTLPEGALISEEYKNISAEEIYSKIHSEQQQQPQPQPGAGTAGSGGSGSLQQQPNQLPPPPSKANNEDFVQPDPGPQQSQPQQPDQQNQDGQDQQPGNTEQDWQQGESPTEGGLAEDNMTETDWQLASEQVAMISRKAGNMPGMMDRGLELGRETKTDWREKLRRFLQASFPSDYSWSKPSKRMISQGLYLPGIIREGMPKIALGCDTSGSISQGYLKAVADELTTIMQEMRPEGVTVLHCDTKITKIEEFAADDEIKLNPKGGGGTDFKPVFDYIENSDEDYKCLLFFSEDLECHDEKKLQELEIPTLWIVPDYCKKGMPFGEIVQVELENKR